MANVLINEDSLTAVANSIRNKNGTTDTYKVSEMDEAINELNALTQDKWIRPSTWPDYSQLDISDMEVIYLTYDTTMTNKWISITAYDDFTVERGSLNNGVFTAATSINCTKGTNFQEDLPTNVGTYVVYRITPQSGKHLERFFFTRKFDMYSTYYFFAQQQPCVERYCNLPNYLGISGRGADSSVWSTRWMVSDTVMNAAPIGSLSNWYDDQSQRLVKIDLSTCSFAEVTSLYCAFNGHYNLYELYLPHDLSSKCTNLGSCFSNLYILKRLDLSGWDTSNVTDMSNLFYLNNNLIEIKGIENFDISKVTTLMRTFRECFNLQKLDLSGWRTTSALTTLEDTFYGCRGLKELDIRGFNVSNVTKLNNTFGQLRSLKSLDLTGWTISDKCTNMSGTFSYSYLLENITIPTNWDTSKVTTFENCFRECKKLKSLNLTGFDFSSATTVKYMLGGCHELENITASFNFTKITSRANISYLFDNCWKLKDFSNISFSNCNFMPGYSYCYSLDKVIAPSTVTGIGDYAFRDMQHLQYIDLTNLTSVPALGSVNDIKQGWNQQLKIFVPDNLFNSWTTTTNWTNTGISMRTYTASDLSLYNNTAQNIATMDLSEITWERNYTFSENSNVGTAYSTVVNAGTVSNAKRITTGLIDFPSNTESLLITFNSSHPCSLLLFDANSKYLKAYFTWYTAPILIHPSTSVPTAKFALFFRIGDGSQTLTPENWADTGISIKYIPIV